MISIVEWFRFVEYFHLVGMIDIWDHRKVGCVMNMIWEYFVFWIDYFVGITLSILDRSSCVSGRYVLSVHCIQHTILILWNITTLLIDKESNCYINHFISIDYSSCRILYHHYHSITFTISPFISTNILYQLDNHNPYHLILFFRLFEIPFYLHLSISISISFHINSQVWMNIKRTQHTCTIINIHSISLMELMEISIWIDSSILIINNS